MDEDIPAGNRESKQTTDIKTEVKDDILVPPGTWFDTVVGPFSDG